MKATAALAALLTLGAGVSQTPQQPVFHSAADLILIDVQVSNNQWQPVADINKEDFEVYIDGRRRKVSTSEFISLTDHQNISTTLIGGDSRITAATRARESRTLILAVDQSSLQITNEPAALEAVTRILALASPEDQIGLVAYPQPGVSVAPTRDRELVRSAVRKIAGQYLPVMMRYNISLSEAVDFSAGDPETKYRVIRRECRTADQACIIQVNDAARELVVNAELQGLRSINGLQSVVEAVREWPGRKTLVVISAGMATTDRIGGRPDIRTEADLLGRRAASANAVIYSLHLDVAFLTQFSARNRGGVQTVYRDAGLAANGLERFTGNAGGTLFTVHAGPDQAINRLLRETSGYYLLAVETVPDDRDGTNHRIQVRVKRKGLTVRSRATVLIPKPR